jgi:hypothetical protein
MAKTTLPDEELKKSLGEMAFEGLEIPKNYLSDGWFEGYYVDGYIFGDVTDTDEEVFTPNFWVKVDRDSLEKNGEKVESVKYKAQVKSDMKHLEHLDFEEVSGYLGEEWFEGYYVDGFLVGPIIEGTDEYIFPEYWIRIKPETMTLAEGQVSK